MAYRGVRPALTLIGVCTAAMTVETGISFISLVGSAGIGLGAVALFRIIRSVDDQLMEAAEVEARIVRRLKELEVNDSVFALDYFEARLEQEIGRARRHGLPLSVIFLEVGAAGIAEGTAVIEAGARLLRTEDTFAPVGRGEYAFFLPETDGAGAQVVVARLAEALKNFQPIFGTASASPSRTDAPSLLEAARESAHRQLIANTWNEGRAVS